MSSILELFGSDRGAGPNKKVESGVNIAEVTNINDPEGKGRIKCQPLIKDEGVRETDWCYVVTPFGGNDNGIFFHPNVGDYVAIAYLGGDIHRPIALGSVWQKKNASPYKLDGEKNQIYAVVTPLHSEMKYTDINGKEKIEITTPSKAKISEDDGEKKLTFTDPDGNNSLVADWGNGEVTIKAQKKLTLKVGSNIIEITSDGSIKIKSDKDISLETVKASVKTTSDTTVEATGSVTIDSKLSATVKSAIDTNIKGATVNVN